MIDLRVGGLLHEPPLGFCMAQANGKQKQNAGTNEKTGKKERSGEERSYAPERKKSWNTIRNVAIEVYPVVSNMYPFCSACQRMMPDS